MATWSKILDAYRRAILLRLCENLNSKSIYRAFVGLRSNGCVNSPRRLRYADRMYAAKKALKLFANLSQFLIISSY